MIHIPHISVFSYGSDPSDRSNPLHMQMNPMFSGSGGGTTGPPKPKSKPLKKPKKKK